MTRASNVRFALLGVAALGLAIAPTASAHRLAAQGAGVCWDGALCFDTHLEGHGEVGVPGVNADFSHFDTSVNSDNGHLSIFGGFSWIEGLTQPATPNHFDDLIEEGVFLERIADGPVTVRATLVLEGSGNILDPNTDIRLLGTVSLFGACGITATKNLYKVLETNWEALGSAPCNELVGSALVVTATYDGDLPTEPVVSARIQSDYFGIYHGAVFDYGYEADLQVELINATATWDTLSFLTQVPEPETDALAIVAIAAVASIASRRRARCERNIPSRQP